MVRNIWLAATEAQLVLGTGVATGTITTATKSEFQETPRAAIIVMLRFDATIHTNRCVCDGIMHPLVIGDSLAPTGLIRNPGCQPTADRRNFARQQTWRLACVASRLVLRRQHPRSTAERSIPKQQRVTGCPQAVNSPEKTWRWSLCIAEKHRKLNWVVGSQYVSEGMSL